MADFRMETGARRGLALLALMGALLIGACDGDVAPPFEVEGAGGIEGRVFHDADEDGEYNPTAGDEALEGVDIVVRERSTDQIFGGATATTDADGRFQVSGLPLATHDLFVDTLTAPSSIQFCQNPIPVTVRSNQFTFEPVGGRSSCLITVAEAEARAADQEYVTVAGVVTSSPGQITGNNTFLQDETGGLLIFGSLDSSIEVGDHIEVSGTIEQFFNTMEITSPTLKSHVADYGEVAPELVTTADIATDGPAPRSFIQGLLVKVEAAELTVAFGGDGMNERNAKINDGSGQAELRIYEGVVDDASTLNNLMSVGSCYDITGVVGEFSSTGQIYPRTMDDIVEVPCS